MRVIGLTGGIGSGKSMAASALRDHGAIVVDADVVAREVVQPGQPLLRAIRENFGPQVITPGGQLDRARLADIVFADDIKREHLEALTHPVILETLHLRIEAATHTGAPLVVGEVPLLFETGHQDYFDGVLLITAKQETQERRLVSAGMGLIQARARISHQWPSDRKAALATWTIPNDGTKEELYARVDAWWRDIVEVPVAEPATGEAL